MTEYTIGSIADLISHGKIKTKKNKKSNFINNEEQCDLFPKKSSKRLKLEEDETEQTEKQHPKSKILKKGKHKIKGYNESVDSNKVDENIKHVPSKYRLKELDDSNEIVFKEKKEHKKKVKCNHFQENKKSTENVKPKYNLNEIENSDGVAFKKKKKHKNKAEIDNNNSNISRVAESTVTVDNTSNSNIRKKQKKKKKKEKNVNKSLETGNDESEFKNLKEESSTKSEIKRKSKKRKHSLNENEDENVFESKNEEKILLDLDHVPTDSEEENEKEKEKAEEPTLSKKMYRQKEFVENTIFIGNIPINYDKTKILKIFSKYGKIKSARIRCVPVANINTTKKVAAVKKEFNPLRNSLVAYVRYESEEGAKAALKANGMVFDGHHIRVDTAEENKKRDINKAIFVGGLPFDIEDDELWEFFEKCGKILSVRVIRDSQTSIGKGFGYVNFDSTGAVELALKLDGELLKNRAIHVKRCLNTRNKNKMNAFGKKKSTELANELLAKRGKKFKIEKKKEKLHPNPVTSNFQGKKANVKEKKKKKLSKSELQRRKMVKILGYSEK